MWPYLQTLGALGTVRALTEYIMAKTKRRRRKLMAHSRRTQIVEISNGFQCEGDMYFFVLFSIEPIKNVNETVNGSHRQLRASLSVCVCMCALLNCSCICKLKMFESLSWRRRNRSLFIYSVWQRMDHFVITSVLGCPAQCLFASKKQKARQVCLQMHVRARLDGERIFVRRLNRIIIAIG